MYQNIQSGGYSRETKKKFFLNFRFSLTDLKKLRKYHLMACKVFIIEQNLKGIAY